jgi:fucose 4-O-acetylase-like acetyltransferase
MLLARSSLFDEIRGLYLFWMVCTHSLTLASPSAASPIQAFWPLGWATNGFVMLTGLVLGARYLQPERRRAYYRAAQIALVAVISNILFLLARRAVEGNLNAASAADAILLRSPWSISSVLLPTAAIVFLSPVLQRAMLAKGSAFMLAALLAVMILIELAVEYLLPDKWEMLARFGSSDEKYFSFPIVSLLRFSVVAYAWGSFLSARPDSRRIMSAGAIIGTALLLVSYWVAEPRFLAAFSRFAIVTGAMAALANHELLGAARSLLGVLGRASLLVFILHRVVLQSSTRVLNDWVSGPPLLLALIVVTLISCYVIARARDEMPAVSHGLRRIGL